MSGYRRTSAWNAGRRAGARGAYYAAKRRRTMSRLRRGYHPEGRKYRGWGRQYHEPSDQTRASFGYSYRSANDAQKAAREAQHYYGRGRYFTGRGRFGFKRFGRKMRHTGRMIGRQARRASHTLDAMAPVAAMIPGVGPELALGMEAAGAGLDDVASVGRHIRGGGRYFTGRGQYAPVQNDSDEIALGQRFSEPHFQAAGIDADDGGLCVSNQEFVANIYANSTGKSFESQVFTVNPGLAQTFPMLSQFAVNFERYEMVQCVFHFETSLDSGVLQSTTGQVGDVLMYSHIDPTEPPFESVAEFMSNGGSMTQVTKGLTCGVECDPGQLAGLPNAGMNHVRSGPMVDSEQAEADQATIQIAVADTPPDMDNFVIGKLYVSYTVKLVKPRLVSLFGGNIMSDTHVGYTSFPIKKNKSVAAFAALASGGPTRLPTGNIQAKVATQYVNETGTSSHLTITFPGWLNGTFRVRVRTMNTRDPIGLVDDDSDDDEAYTAPANSADLVLPLIQEPVPTGNVKVLPHNLDVHGGSPWMGHAVTSNHSWPSTTTSTAYASVDNFVVFSFVDNPPVEAVAAVEEEVDGSGNVTTEAVAAVAAAPANTGLTFSGYVEFVVRLSPATGETDNSIRLNLMDNVGIWPQYGYNADTSADAIATVVNVETCNNHGLRDSMTLHQRGAELVARNSIIAEYNAV